MNDHRKIWGAGFRAGLEHNMNHARATSKLKSMTTLAQKVYDAIPAEEEWTTHQIIGELGRLGITHDKHTISGCLGALKESGLIYEPSTGLYKRIAVRERPTLKVASTMPTQKENSTPMSIDNEFDALHARLEEVGVMLLGITEDVTKLKKRYNESRGDVEKLKQLKGLLAELT